MTDHANVTRLLFILLAKYIYTGIPFEIAPASPFSIAFLSLSFSSCFPGPASKNGKQQENDKERNAIENNDAGAIYINHDKGEGLYDVYHRVNDYEKGRKIRFLETYTEEKLGKFFNDQIDIDNDLWLIEVVSSKIDLEAFFREQGL